MNYFKIARFFLYLVPFSVVIVTRSTLFPFIVGKFAWFRTSIDIALIFVLLGLLYARDKHIYEVQVSKVIKAPLTIATAIFAGVFVLAGLFGRNSQYSFWSNFERGEGGIQIIHLFIFFVLMGVLLRDKKDWMNFFMAWVFGAILMVLYGVGAGLDWPWFAGARFGAESFRFQGSIGNPAYVAAYLIFSIFYATYLWFEKCRDKKLSSESIMLLLSIVAFLLFFLLAATRGAFIGLGIGALVTLGYLTYSKKEWRIKLIGAGVALIFLVSLLVGFRNTDFVKRIPGSRIFDITVNAKTFQHRTIMWGIAWKSFLERPILGWGPESYGYLFQKNFNPIYFEPTEGFGAWFDRAHSIYFDSLAETGIVGFLSYMSLFVIFYWQIIKKKKQFKDELSLAGIALLFAVPITYLVQGIVLFDVLVIYLNVFVVLAFGAYLSSGDNMEDKKL